MVYLRRVKRVIWVAVCLTAVLALSCRDGAGRAGGASEQQVAALTASSGASTAAQDQALADAFARQAAVYVQVATTDRAQAAAVSTAIATEQQLTAAKAAAATASALTTAATSLSTSTLATGTTLATAAAKIEDHYQRVAALADQLRANAQALANFHLARAGLAAEGGAQ